MCTLTVFPSAHGHIVTMNRDEANDRAEAGEHLKFNGQQLEQWWPIDSVSSGTWFGLRGDGLVAALLNRYQGRSASPITSRGIIIPTLFAEAHNDSLEWMMKQNWEKFASFDLVLVHNNAIAQCSWDDGQLQIHEHARHSPFFLSSSSFEYEESMSVRRAAFERFIQEADASDPQMILEGLHRKEDLDNPTLSFIMRRPGRRTKSIAQAIATSQSPWHRYIPLN